MGEILEVAKITDGGFEMPKFYAPFVGDELKQGFFALSRDSAFKSLIKSLESVENADIDVPESLKLVMRNYQKTGYRFYKTSQLTDAARCLRTIISAVFSPTTWA